VADSARKIVLIGAGSAVFTRGLVADLILSGRPWTVSLVDVDAEALEIASSLAGRMVAAREAAIELEADTERRNVLTGADYVVSTIGVGGRRAWEADVLIPRKYGIFQPVGDTIMPGGLSRALRQIPATLALVRDAARLAPEAYVFNYANPMAAICQAVWKECRRDIVGLCHGVPNGERELAELLEVESSRCSFTAVGINHLSFFIEARVDGEDAFPLLRQKLLHGGLKDGESLRNRLFLDTGLYSVLHDRHLAEFFPQFHRDGSHPEGKLGVDVFSFEETIERGDRDYADMKAQAFGEKPLDHKVFDHHLGEHEQLVEILESLQGPSRRRYSMILPNRGHLAGLPAGHALECPAWVSAAGIDPERIVNIPAFLKALLGKHLSVIDLVIEAAVEREKTAFLEALILDGAVDSLGKAARLADDLWEVNERYCAAP